MPETEKIPLKEIIYLYNRRKRCLLNLKKGNVIKFEVKAMDEKISTYYFFSEGKSDEQSEEAYGNLIFLNEQNKKNYTLAANCRLSIDHLVKNGFEISLFVKK